MTPPSSREFDLGDILSVTTRLLVSPRHIERSPSLHLRGGLMSIPTTFASHAEARKAGWFSRRHPDMSAHRGQQESDRAVRQLQLEEGVERNTAWASMSTKAKLASLVRRNLASPTIKVGNIVIAGGSSHRQIAKLLKEDK